MNITWFLAIILTMTVIMLLLLIIFSKAILQGVAAFFGKIINKRVEQKKGDIDEC